MTDRCFYFGVWDGAGHYLYAPGGAPVRQQDRFAQRFLAGKISIDGALAPRRLNSTHELVWLAMLETVQSRATLDYRSHEYDQGHFLHHHLDTGFSALQWWDRTQGDHRGACNSTILLEGRRTSEELLAAFALHFPSRLARLHAAGISLVEVHHVAR